VMFPKDKFPAYAKNPEAPIRAELARYLNSERADLWAWCFPEERRKLYSKSERCFYPGVVLGLRRLPERKK